MNTVLRYKGYSAKPEYSADDQVFYGKILGIRDLVDFYTENAKDVENEFHKAVDDYLAFCAEIGKEPEKEFSGTFNVRVSPELHRKAYARSQENNVSLNKVVEAALAEYLAPQSSAQNTPPVFPQHPQGGRSIYATGQARDSNLQLPAAKWANAIANSTKGWS
jgi:predicted HicB family RNase H-like nuclease